MCIRDRYTDHRFRIWRQAARHIPPRWIRYTEEYRRERLSLIHIYGGRRLPIYGSGVLHPREKVIIQKMADSMGVSFTALVIRLRGFGMLNYHPLEEYMEKEIRQGGIRRAD